MDRNMDRRKRQETARLIDGYQLLVEKEAEARENGDERHLRHCLAGQKQVRRELRRRLPA